MNPLKQTDPYFNTIAWEIIYDAAGRPVGEVFLVPFADRIRLKFKYKRIKGVRKKH